MMRCLRKSAVHVVIIDALNEEVAYLLKQRRCVLHILHAVYNFRRASYAQSWFRLNPWAGSACFPAQVQTVATGVVHSVPLRWFIPTPEPVSDWFLPAGVLCIPGLYRPVSTPSAYVVPAGTNNCAVGDIRYACFGITDYGCGSESTASLTIVVKSV
jgi:hypothetical protein